VFIVKFSSNTPVETPHGKRVFMDSIPYLMLSEYVGFKKIFNVIDTDADFQFCTSLDEISKDKVAIIVDLSLGDALMISPLIRQLIKDNPTKKFMVVTGENSSYVLNACRLPIEVRATPILLDALEDWECVYLQIPQEGADNYKEYFEMKDDGDNDLVCYPNPNTQEYWKDWLNGNRIHVIEGRRFECNFYTPTKPLVIWQLAASSVCKTYPPVKMLEISDRVTEEANCLMVGSLDQAYYYLAEATQLGVDLTYKFNLNEHKTAVIGGLTEQVSDLIALLSNADVIVAFDSFLLHLGRALGIPVVAVVPNKNLIKNFYGENVTIVGGKELDCQPCNREVCLYPDEYGFGMCSSYIDPEEVYNAVIKSLKGKIC